VCGGNALAVRLVYELVTRFDAEVAVALSDPAEGQWPQLALLPGVRLVRAPEITESVLRTAGVRDAQAMALVGDDDVDNIHVALVAQELNPAIRLVLRMHPRLGARIRRLFNDCAVLSASRVAAPSFVAAALGAEAPNQVEFGANRFYAARRRDVPPHRIICGLADTSASHEEADVGVELLPADQNRADLVLAIADDEADRAPRRRPLTWLRRARYLLRNKMILVVVAMVLLVALGVVLMACVDPHRGWGSAVYDGLMDAAGDAQPNDQFSGFDKATQLTVVYAGLALIPLVTAVAVDGLLRARLAGHSRGPVRRDGHVVVVGLGSVGVRVLRQLHDLGVPVVAVEIDENVRGVVIARRMGIPVVIGDAAWPETLRAAGVARARSLLLLTTSEIANLEGALLGGSYRDDLRVVLRIFDDDLAERVERRLGIVISRSVSRLAAPSFAAAMVEREVIGTLSVGRAPVLIAEIPVYPGSALIGQSVHSVNDPGATRVIAIGHDGGDALDYRPIPDYRLKSHDRLVVVATRLGLGSLLAGSGPPEATPAPLPRAL
jgi:Trk K+ transport system NAD-binding subunit